MRPNSIAVPQRNPSARFHKAALIAASLVIGLFALSTATAAAQATSTAGTPPPNPSRVDFFAGYSYLHPVDSDINNVKYQPINPGAVGSITGYLSNHWGIQAEGSAHPDGPNDCVYTAQAGPVFRMNFNRFVPFAHALAGGARVGGPVFQPCTWGWGVTSGIGFDYILPVWNNHLAIRPIQADFHYSHVDNGPLQPPGFVTGGLSEIYAYKLSAGLVLRMGATSVPPPVQLGCTAKPVDVFPGDPIEISATPANLLPKKLVTYTWTSTGGQISGTGETAHVNTTGAAAGDYTATGHITQGPHPGQSADCTAGFRVHAYEPPTIACTANPATVLYGGSSTITAVGSSPQNRALTYSYNASAGQISGNGTTATLSTAGAAPGTVTVTCNVVDDLGKNATATTSVVVTPPTIPPPPSARPLCTSQFERDSKRPVRVDNEAKACLDDVALNLNRESTARLIIIGHHSSDEQPTAAAQRVLNVQQYLTDEKGIDASRIELRTSDSAGRSVESILVPQGATFDPAGTATFDSSSVKRTGQAYGTVRSGATRK
jgi:hypothetical protein